MVDQPTISDLVRGPIPLWNNFCQCCWLRSFWDFRRSARKALWGKTPHSEWFHGSFYYVFDI